MSLKKVLSDLTKVVSDEAARNPEFAKRLENILNRASSGPPRKGDSSPVGDSLDHKRRRRNGRASAVLDPVALVAESEDVLRSQLALLSLDQLKDIVAEYGMDPGKLVMKWRTPRRVIEKIVELSLGRARKGDAFRS